MQVRLLKRERLLANIRNMFPITFRTQCKEKSRHAFSPCPDKAFSLQWKTVVNQTSPQK